MTCAPLDHESVATLLKHHWLLVWWVWSSVCSLFVVSRA